VDRNPLSDSAYNFKALTPMAAMIAAAIGVTHPANATQSLYEVYDLGALPSDQGVSQAYAINNSGSVVGSGPGAAVRPGFGIGATACAASARSPAEMGTLGQPQ
jgi:hypothetical protein